MNRTKWFILALTGLFALAGAAQPALQTLVSTGLSEPYGVAVDAANNFYVTDSVNNRIARYNPTTGAFENLAGSTEESGRVDGPGVFARFFNPQGIITARGGLVVADSGNHLIRFVALDGTVSTLAGTTFGFRDGPGNTAQFNSPAGLSSDAAGNIYVADMLNHRIRKIDNNNEVTTYATGLSRPEAVAMDRATGTLYVADTGTHTIKTVSPAGVVAMLAGNGIRGMRNDLIAAKAQFNAPRGMVWVGGKTGLVVSDTGNHLVRRVYFNTNAVVNGFSVETYAGGAEGALNAPVGLAIDEDGNLPLADLGNHRLLSIQVTAPQAPVSSPEIGFVILTTNLFGQLRTSLVGVTNATFNNDVKVAILAERGTDTFFSLDRDADFPTDPNSRNTPAAYENGLLDWTHSLIRPEVDGSDVVIRAVSTQTGRKSSPIVTAIFKFKAAGTVINGKNPGGFTMENATDGAEVWYTTDGSTPTNGFPSRLYSPGSRLNVVDGTNNVLVKVGAFKPGYIPSFVEKTFFFSDLQTSSIGVTRNFSGGIGSTLIVPVEVKLAPEDVLKSVQFRFEVRANGGAPPISTQLRTLMISTNDFVQIPVPSTNAPISSVYSNDATTGLSVSFLGSNTGLEIEEAAIIALVAVPIPPTASVNQTYTIEVREASGTIDGYQTPVPLSIFANRTITVGNVSYVVGDSAVADWYNAGDFGNGNLNNNDVNNAFHASLGLNAPWAFTDVFDAMDAYPEDTVGSVGGDGQIRFLDWQVILQRSLRLKAENWQRSWSAGGQRVASGATLNTAANLPGLAVESLPGAVWVRQAAVASTHIENAQPGAVASLPVYVTVNPGESLSGLQFFATIEGENGAPELTSAARFIRAGGIPSSRSVDAPGLNQVGYAWDLGSFQPELQGRHLLGSIEFNIPAAAKRGQGYTLRFGNADGAPNLEEQYEFETFASGVWVQSNRAGASDQTSDEWKKHFFGNIRNPLAQPAVDADGDGVPNWKEYLCGTNPTKAASRLQLLAPEHRVNGNRREVGVKWLTAPGKQYVIETTTSLTPPSWRIIATGVQGDGNYQEVTDSNPSRTVQYYRVRLK